MTSPLDSRTGEPLADVIEDELDSHHQEELACSCGGVVSMTLTYHEAPNPDPLTVPEIPAHELAYLRAYTIRDRPGITIPLLLAIVVVVAAVVAVAIWGGTW